MEIQVDPIKCEAHGLCAELLPERITLDEWGYPIIDPTPIPPGLEDLARRAVNACPTLALRLRAVENPGLHLPPERERNPRARQPPPGPPKRVTREPYQVYRGRRG